MLWFKQDYLFEGHFSKKSRGYPAWVEVSGADTLVPPKGGWTKTEECVIEGQRTNTHVDFDVCQNIRGMILKAVKLKLLFGTS